MILRPYQIKAVADIRESLLTFGSTVFVLPTGGGKTAISAEIARRVADKGKTVFYVVHRRELVKQTIKTLKLANPNIHVGVVGRGWIDLPWSKFRVGMIQTMIRREGIKEPDLTVYDECHHIRAWMWDEIYNRWPNSYKLGLTATPERLDKKGLGTHFADMVMGPTTPELIDDKFLCPIQVFRLPKTINVEGVPLDRYGEYRKSHLSKRVTDKVIADGVKAYMRYTPHKKALFFGVDTNHSRRVCEGLRSVGIKAEHLDGQDRAERRDAVINNFEYGDLEVICNCALFQEGLDVPSCSVIIMGAPTKSITNYLQMIGRAMRPGVGKLAIVLDLCGNSHQLGLPDEAREWSLEDGHVPLEKKKGYRPSRTCRDCYTAFHGSHCPNCGAEYETQAAELNEIDTLLEVVKSRPNKKRPRVGNRKELKRLVWEAKGADDPKAALMKIAEDRGYQQNWVHIILRTWKL